MSSEAGAAPPASLAARGARVRGLLAGLGAGSTAGVAAAGLVAWAAAVAGVGGSGGAGGAGGASAAVEGRAAVEDEEVGVAGRAVETAGAATSGPAAMERE